MIKTKYNIGDLIVIPFVEKIGIIIDIDNNKKLNYKIFWQWKTGETRIDESDERTINLWLSIVEGKRKHNLNQYYPVPKVKNEF